MKPRYTSAVFVPRTSAAIGSPNSFQAILPQRALPCDGNAAVHAIERKDRLRQKSGRADPVGSDQQPDASFVVTCRASAPCSRPCQIIVDTMFTALNTT